MKIVAYNKCSLLDYNPYLSAVVFTPGCNMNCAYCHNKDLLHSTDYLSESDILEHLANSSMLDAVVISGGEPTLQGQAVIDFAAQVKALGYRLKLDTNGSNPQLLKRLIEQNYVDYIAMDIKAEPQDYRLVSGLSFDKVKQSIDLIRAFSNYEFRTTVYPLISLDSLERLCQTYQHDHYFLQQYRKMEDDTLEPYPDQTLQSIADRYHIPLRS